MRTFRVTYAIRTESGEPAGRRTMVWDAENESDLEATFTAEMPGFFIVRFTEITN